MKAGFIFRDKRRLALIKDLSKSPQTRRTLARKNRLTEEVVWKVVEPMIEGGIVDDHEGTYSLTEDGEDLAKRIRELERSTNMHSTPDGERESARLRVAPDHKRDQIKMKK